MSTTGPKPLFTPTGTISFKKYAVKRGKIKRLYAIVSGGLSHEQRKGEGFGSCYEDDVKMPDDGGVTNRMTG